VAISKTKFMIVSLNYYNENEYVKIGLYKKAAGHCIVLLIYNVALLCAFFRFAINTYCIIGKKCVR